MDIFLTSLGLMLVCVQCSAQKLSPTGKNVCFNTRDSSPICCSGWSQQGDECTVPLCEGERACLQDEVCVYPGFCRCKPGYYGYQCKTRDKNSCPPEFWGPDCRELCPCHPYGLCDPVTGECSCFLNRWGNLCQNSCKCGRHGKCDPVYGNCTCEEGWWTSTCSKACQCHPSTSTCDQATGRCLCNNLYWGQKCSLRCNCYVSPCQQHNGECQCLSGWWGSSCDRRCNCDLSHADCPASNGTCLCHPGYKSPFCHETCSDGKYGRGCEKSCGRCKGGRPCSKQEGLCDSCEPGWNGTRCDQRCPAGYYGHHCQEVCPQCRNKKTCDPETGACLFCDPGWTGPRCDKPCTDGTYGDGCRFLCKPCYHGHCDHMTGNCACLPGFQGESCNNTCPVHSYGINCSSVCDCGNLACHPTTGACPHSSRAGLLAGLLIPLFLLILALLFCCCCCGPVEEKEGMVVGDGSPAVRMKHHVYTVLANMTSAIPCISMWSSGLPRVTVSHHDPELTFNHSFIEQPSSSWVTDSFETDDDGEAVYCEPPREDVLTVAGGELQELNSKCNFFLDPSNFSSEDMSQAFGIPRTSSIAKSKRPSVSFAEGTKFSPKERRSSTQDLPGSGRKPKTWGVLMLSALQVGQGNHSEQENAEEKNNEENVYSDEQAATTETPEADSERYNSGPLRTHGSVSGGRRRTLSNTRKNTHPQSSSDGGQDTDSEVEKLTTVYVTVGKTPQMVKQEPSSEGPVQAMLRRLGSLQRQKDVAAQPRGRGQVITKPPRRKLGARASAWEQGSGSGQAEVVMRKPSRKKHSSLSSPCIVGETDFPQDNSAPKRPLSSILKSVPESDTHRSLVEQNTETVSQTDAMGEHAYETVALSDGVSTSTEIIINETVVEQTENEPNYENVYVKHS